MELDITSCSFCLHSYNDRERRPLVLPCSHSFCQNCLVKLESVGDRSCPTCGANWGDKPVAELICCHQLIPVASSDKRKVARCSEHKLEKSLWCESCGSALCIECIELQHKTCTWYSIKKKRTLLKTEGGQIFSKLKKEMQDNQSLMTFFNEMTTHQEKIAAWQIKCENAIEVYKKVGKEAPGSDEIKDLLQLMDAIGSVKELVDTTHSEPLILQVTRAYQNTPDGKLESFLSKLMVNLKSDKLENIHPEEETKIIVTESQIKVASAFVKHGQRWEINDTAHAVAAHRALTTSGSRPQDVYVKGTKWREEELLKFLSSVSKTACPVFFAPRDTFWKPTAITREKFRRRIDTLLSPGHKCVLKLVWGHMDLTTVRALPQTVENVGLVVGSKEDMDLVRALDESRGGEMGFSSKAYIHLCYEDSFKPADWGTQLENHRQRSVPFCLHFPKLQQNRLPWMKSVISKVSRNYKYIGCIHALYLPGTSVDSDAVLGAMKDNKLQAIVKMPEDLAPQTGIKEMEDRFRALKSSVQWDLEQL